MIVRRPEISVKALGEFMDVVSDGDMLSFPSARAFLSYIDRTLGTKDTFQEGTVSLSCCAVQQPPQEYHFLYRRITEVVNHLLFVHRDNLLHPTLLEDGDVRFDHAVHAQRYQSLLRAFRLTHDEKDILLPLSFFSGRLFSSCCGLCGRSCFSLWTHQLMMHVCRRDELNFVSIAECQRCRLPAVHVYAHARA